MIKKINSKNMKKGKCIEDNKKKSLDSKHNSGKIIEDKDFDEINKSNKSKQLVTTLGTSNPDKLKNPHKYHRDLTIKEREKIIKESTKIVNLIKDIENGIISKDILKFMTKYYHLDKTYFN